MTEKITPQSVYCQAEEIGYRFEDVILKPAESFGDTQTRILQSDDQQVKLAPEYIRLEDRRYEHQKVSHTDLEREINNGLKFRVKLRDKLGILAVPAAFATMETLTNSAAVGSASAGIGLGSYVLYLAKQGISNRHEYLHRLDHDVQNLRDEVMSGTETVRINNPNDVNFYLEERSDKLLDSVVKLSGQGEDELPARDILSWYEQLMSNVKLRILCSRNGDDIYIDSAYSERKPFVRVGKPLSSIFEEADLDGYGIRNLRTAKNKKKFYKENADQIVTTLSTKSNALHRGVQKEESKPANSNAESSECDPTVTMVFLPPGKVIESLLITDQNPAELWKLIYEDAVQLQELMDKIHDSREKLTFIGRRAKHAGISNAQDKKEIEDLEKIINDSEKESLRLTLSILGTGAVRDRAHRYDAVREELVASLGDTVKAGDQYSAIQLFGAGIDALALSIDPDSEEAIVTSKELKRYLLGAVPYIDGTKNAYDQLYEGMALRFPRLKLR